MERERERRDRERETERQREMEMIVAPRELCSLTWEKVETLFTWFTYIFTVHLLS